MSNMRNNEFKAQNKDSDFSHKPKADTVLGRANTDPKRTAASDKTSSGKNKRYMQSFSDNAARDNFHVHEKQNSVIANTQHSREIYSDVEQEQTADEQQADFSSDDKSAAADEHFGNVNKPQKSGFSHKAVKAAADYGRYRQDERQNNIPSSAAPENKAERVTTENPADRIEPKESARHTQDRQQRSSEDANHTANDAVTPKIENDIRKIYIKDEKYNIKEAASSKDEAFDIVSGKSDIQFGAADEKPTAESKAKNPKRKQHRPKLSLTETEIKSDKLTADKEKTVDNTDFETGGADFTDAVFDGSETRDFDISDRPYDDIDLSENKDFRLGKQKTSFVKDKPKPEKKSNQPDASEQKSDTAIQETSEQKSGNKTDITVNDQAIVSEQNRVYQKKRVKPDKSEAYNIRDAVMEKDTAFDRVEKPADFEFTNPVAENEYSFIRQPPDTDTKKRKTRLKRKKSDETSSREQKNADNISFESSDTSIPEKGDFQFMRAEKAQANAERLSAKTDKSGKRISRKTAVKTENEITPDAKSSKRKPRLMFEKEILPQKDLYKRRPMRSAVEITGGVISQKAHSKVRENEQDNVGVEAAHASEEKAEQILTLGKRTRRLISQKHNNANYQKAARLRFEADKSEAKAAFEKAKVQNPELRKKTFTKKAMQKKQIKRQYQKIKYAEQQGKTAKTTVKAAKDTAVKTSEFVYRHKKAFGTIILIALLIAWVISTVSSCAVMGTQGINSILTSSYFAEDEDIYAAEDYYLNFETELQTELDNIELNYPGYDEYRYDTAQIGHNPYELISFLTALNQEFTFDDTVKAELENLFRQQYSLTLTETIETRTDSEGNSYTYYILNVTLTNSGITAVANSNLTADQLELYGIYLESKGNRDYLFEDDIYSNQAEAAGYRIPGAALTDTSFRRLITEAEKYLGYPYVWGGSSPSTSFDCSGFVCWVFNNSGVYPLSRTTAQGIYDQCAVISRSDAKPGDIIFFTGTYSTSDAVTHVGIYVGDGMMIHCGNPIQYADIDNSYWQSHFYAFGRLN